MERSGLSSGTQIGGYTIVAPLGSGGMGTVYRAADDGGAEVALKLLHPHVASDAAVRARLLREVAALQRLRHPAVASVLDAETDSTEAFIVTELVAGQTLAERVRERGPLDTDELVALAEGLRAALAAVHAAGVVHRDLKPANVMLTDDGPVLIDFGLAQGVDDDANLTSAGFVLGTPGYLAPELLDGGEPSVATDTWGWAALLAFAATGRDPFGSRPVEAVLARARAGEVDLDGVGPAVRAAVAGALRPAPADRSDPEDVVAALRAVAADGEPEADVVPTVVLGAGTAAAAAAGRDPVEEDPDGDLDGEDPDDGDLDDGDLDDGDLDDGDLDDGDPDDGDPVQRPDDDLATELVAQRAPSARDDQATVAVGTATAVVAPSLPPVRDGRTVAVPVRQPAAEGTVPAPTEVPVDPASETPFDEWGDADEHDAVDDDTEAADEDWYQRPPVPRRWGSLLALAVVVALAGTMHPAVTVAAVLVLAVLARTVGGTVEAMHARRERRGVGRSDRLVACLATPWYLLLAVLGVLPAVLVGGAVVLILGGVGWWLLGAGQWGIGGSPPGQEPQGLTASLLVGLLVAVFVAFVWRGPLSRMTRTGARRTLALVAPGPVGALVVVVLALVAAVVLADRLLDVQPIVWWPASAPTLPAP